MLLRDFYILDGDREKAERADLRIIDNKIACITAPGSLRANDGEETFDGGGKHLLLPGFVNCHCHSAMTLLRGLGEEEPLKDWLEKKIWPREARLTAEQVYSGTSLAVLEMAMGGVTCFADMYMQMASVTKAVNELGIRGGISVGVVSRNPFLLKQSLYRDFSDVRGPLIINNLDPHAPYTVTLDGMKEIAAAAAQFDLPLETHFLEAEWERGYIEKTFSMSPLQYLEETGLLKLHHLILAHCVYLTAEEMSQLADYNVTVVHCPTSNLKLGSGIADLPRMLNSGLSVALGTDGAASNNRLDIWAEMRLAALIHKGTSKDPTVISARQILRCATYEGALGLGFRRVGLIRPEWAADLTVVDLTGPQYTGTDCMNMAGYVVYAGSAADVTDVLCAGRWLVRNRKFLPRPAEQIIADADRKRAELLQSVKM